MREVKNPGKYLHNSEEEFEKFFACMPIGIYNSPRIRMFWRLDSKVPIVSDTVDDDSISKETRANDWFWKVRPMLDRIQSACLQNKKTSNVSIDERMICFNGKVLMRHLCEKNHVGLKNFVMTTPTRIPVDYLFLSIDTSHLRR
ncbi:hypothetical protein JTB14_003115 [Gonioctena quinquepunctata]|nr:hypothetical protein JTB14_003115 [Gonioctena quinquepunctata]